MSARGGGGDGGDGSDGGRDGGGGGGDGAMSHGQTRSWLEEYAQHEYVLGCVLWYDEDGFIRIE